MTRFARNLLSAALLATAVALAPGAQATPTDDLQAALAANGGPSVQNAKPRQFEAAFAAVIAGKSAKAIDQYAAAAVKLRPKLASEIARIALAALTPPGGKPNASIVADLVAAIILADPTAAGDVVAEALQADPEARRNIIAAAVGVAPEELQAINNAASRQPGVFAQLGFSLGNMDGRDAGIISGSSLGTLNPSNISGANTSTSGSGSTGTAPPPSGVDTNSQSTVLPGG